jgi:hypothetical protein
MSWLSRDQEQAIRVVAASQEWDKMPTDSVRLLMWCAFHYYVMRLKGEAQPERNSS